MKIYTKKGDEGKTQLFGGQSMSKSDLRIHAYGDIDELNSHFGLLESRLPSLTDAGLKSELRDWILAVQNDLFCIGGRLAAATTSLREKLPVFPNTRVDEMEKAMDAWTEKLPALTNFVLPGGHELASLFHVVRTITRRCERRVVALQEAGDSGLAPDIIYLNRLSDFCFTAARWVNLKCRLPDAVWIATTTPKRDP